MVSVGVRKAQGAQKRFFTVPSNYFCALNWISQFESETEAPKNKGDAPQETQKRSKQALPSFKQFVVNWVRGLLNASPTLNSSWSRLAYTLTPIDKQVCASHKRAIHLGVGLLLLPR